MKHRVPYTDLLKQMISIPAHSREEGNRAGFLEEFLGGLGYRVKRIHNNLLLGEPLENGQVANVLLNSHMDTVSPVDGWEGNPYEPLTEGDRITGLGSNDAGGSVVAMIAAYHEMASTLRDEINLMLLISAEEEVSGTGGIGSVLPMLGNLDGAIVGEPTGMRPAVAERGLMVLDGVVRGKAGHAARDEGVNAIYRAMEDIQSITQLSFSEKSAWLPPPGAQVTMISAGTVHNVVPDHCRYVVDVRSNDRYGNERILEMISGVCVAELVPRSTRLRPSLLEEDHIMMRTIRSRGLQPFGSSTLSDMALIPFPSIKMGPGDSSRSHTAGEYILQSELEAGFAGYCDFLTGLKEQYKNPHS